MKATGSTITLVFLPNYIAYHPRRTQFSHIQWSCIICIFDLCKFNHMHSPEEEENRNLNSADNSMRCACAWGERKPWLYLSYCLFNRSLKVAVQGPDFWPTSSTYIHTYIHTACLNAGILPYYMAPKCKPTTSSGAQQKKPRYVPALQEKLAVLGLWWYFGVKHGVQIWPQHYIHTYYTVYKKAKPYGRFVGFSRVILFTGSFGFIHCL
jgi:hypothetical protein